MGTKFHNHQRSTYTLDKPLSYRYRERNPERTQREVYPPIEEETTAFQKGLMKKFHHRKQRQWNKSVIQQYEKEG